MKSAIFYFFTTILLFSNCKFSETPVKKPKLVIGIVIDQMRYDYLTRFADRYGKDGFNRILKNF